MALSAVPHLRALQNILRVEGTVTNDTDQKGMGLIPKMGATSGIGNRVKLTNRDRELLWNLNPDDSTATRLEKMQYAIGEWTETGDWSGALYSGDAKGWEATEVWWPLIVECSPFSPNVYRPKNIVKVLEYLDGFARIETLPLDYDSMNVNHLPPWLVHRVYKTTIKGITNDTPKGILRMPLLNPLVRIHRGGDGTGVWLEQSYLAEEILPTQIPPVPTVPFAVTVKGVPKYIFGVLTYQKLNIRESASLHNLGNFGFLNPGTPAEIIEVGVNADGVFGKINRAGPGLWICLHNALKNEYYTSWRPQ